MKQLKRTGVYQASNVSYDPKTKTAFSYRWWQFCGVINGLTVFNHHRYSPSTGQQQQKVRGLMYRLGHTVDVWIKCRTGLQGATFKTDCILYARKSVERLEAKNKKGRSGSWAYALRCQQISSFQEQIKWAETL